MNLKESISLAIGGMILVTMPSWVLLIFLKLNGC